jgi:hypothetical protein
MDISTIASFISLEIARGFLKEHGKDIYDKAKQLLTPDELISLNLLESHPQDQELQNRVRTAFERHLAANPTATEELSVLVTQLSQSDESQKNINQCGDRNVAVQDVYGSTININKS